MNAHDFVLDLADQLVAQGREVEIEEEPDSIRIFARARNLAENTIGASAYLSSYSNRWRFLSITAYRILGEPVKEKTRRRARTVALVYGQSYVREEVSA